MPPEIIALLVVAIFSYVLAGVVAAVFRSVAYNRREPDSTDVVIIVLWPMVLIAVFIMGVVKLFREFYEG